MAARWTATMTHQGEFLGFAPTGKKATITGTSTQRIANGKIVEGWDNWDQLGLLVQIGACSCRAFRAARGTALGLNACSPRKLNSIKEGHSCPFRHSLVICLAIRPQSKP